MLRIKLWRHQNRLTQEEAAARLGLSVSAYALLESGRLRASPGQIEQLRRTFGAAADTLFDPVDERVEAAP